MSVWIEKNIFFEGGIGYGRDYAAMDLPHCQIRPWQWEQMGRLGKPLETMGRKARG